MMKGDGTNNSGFFFFSFHYFLNQGSFVARIQKHLSSVKKEGHGSYKSKEDLAETHGGSSEGSHRH